MDNNSKALKRIISKFETQWQGQAELAIKRLYSLMDSGLKTDAAVRKLRQEFPQIFQLIGIEDALIEAAAYGYGIMPSVLTSVDRKNIAKVIEQPWSADGMKLSQKLHAYDDVLYNTITNIVQEQVKKNATALQISRQLYDGYTKGNDNLKRNRFTEDQRLPKYINNIKRLQNATAEDSRDIRKAAANIDRLARNNAPNRALKAGYSKLLKAVEGNNEKAIQNAINVAVNEKSRYIADRIARTEMARAYADGFFSKHNNDPDVVGYEYELSTRHPVFDICDMYAKANMFNLGKGIYPKDKVPLIPVHPHCLCTYSVLYKGQIDLSKQRNQQHQAIATWLNGLDEKHAVQVMGREGYNLFKASKIASNKSNSRTNSNIAAHTNKYSYERFIRSYQGLGNPQYRKITLFDAQYKYIDYKDKEARKEEFYKWQKTISVREIRNGNIKTYIAENVKINPQMIKELNSQVDYVLQKMGLKNPQNLPRMVIVSDVDIGTKTAGAYITVNNTLYINHGVIRENGIHKFISPKGAVSLDKHATLAHELYHWRDAQQYIEKYGAITSQEEYKKAIIEISQPKVAKLIKLGYNIDNISDYAAKNLVKRRYDEVITEYRTKVLLEGKKKVIAELKEG